MNDAEAGDIYIDAQGKLWRVLGTCREPTVYVQEVETLTPDSPVKRSGGVFGLMWQGFNRIHRPEKRKEPPRNFNAAPGADWAM
jgi:hypothetical protein